MRALARPEVVGVAGGRKGSVRIVTDSTAILTHDYVVAHDLQVAPQIIHFGEDSFLENVTISSPEFYRQLRSSRGLPKTSAPAPGDFATAYEKDLVRAETIISIHPTADASGTVRSAETARQQWFPDADIRVIDTRTIAGCLGEIVRQAVAWAEAGASADAIVADVEAMAARARSYFLVPTLDYLQRGGRIGGAAALLGSILQVKPILEIHDGRVQVLERVRVLSKARERMLELTIDRCRRSPDPRLCVMHGDVPAEADAVAEELSRRLGSTKPPIFEVGAAIATHVGPGVVALGFFVS
jgi:DegV family protein with EDD domain